MTHVAEITYRNQLSLAYKIDESTVDKLEEALHNKATFFKFDQEGGTRANVSLEGILVVNILTNERYEQLQKQAQDEARKQQTRQNLSGGVLGK